MEMEIRPGIQLVAIKQDHKTEKITVLRQKGGINYDPAGLYCFRPFIVS